MKNSELEIEKGHDMTERVSAKVQHREKLIEYLANPDNRFPTRGYLSMEVLGFSQGSVLYTFFTPLELSEIEMEALELRRKCYAAKLAKVDDAVLTSAMEGDLQAAKLAFQRYEGWTEKQKREITFDGPMLQQIFAILPPEIGEALKVALVAQQREAIDV